MVYSIFRRTQQGPAHLMVLDLWVSVPGSDLARKFVERLVQWIFSCPECARRHACGAQGVDGAGTPGTPGTPVLVERKGNQEEMWRCV